MNKLLFTSLFILLTSYVFSQNNLLLNPMLYNPAIAGQNEKTDISLTGFNILTNIGGVDYNGQTLNFSTSIRDRQFGLGGNLIRKEIVYNEFVELNGFFAYHQSLRFGQLSVGTSLGFTKDAYNFLGVQFSGPVPYVSLKDTDYSFNLGLGAMFTSKYGYLGVSSSNVFRKTRTFVLVGSLYDYRLSPNRQMIFSGGLRFPMFSEKLIIRPSIVYTQSLEGALRATDTWSELQLNASFQLFDRVWLNTAIFSSVTQLTGLSQTIEFGAGYLFKDGIRLGCNYRVFKEEIFFNPDILEVVLGTRLSKVDNHNSGVNHFF